MRWNSCLALLFMTVVAGCAAPPHYQAEGDEVQGSIAFGSCLHQWRAQPVWDSVVAMSPAAFIFTGDNVYADVRGYSRLPVPEAIASAYGNLASSPEFSRFREIASQQDMALHAVWDDHDYGRNDAGADFPYRLESKRAFSDFFGIDDTVTGADRPGIYREETLTVAGLRVQLLLLDTRSFRSELRSGDKTAACPRKRYEANTDAQATILGDAQWQWLEAALSRPADLRLLVSSIQVLPSEHCFEKWANFPRERDRLLELLRRSEAEAVVILSGDRHLGEISRLPEQEIGYPLYELTSSGLNSAIGWSLLWQGESNALRTSPEPVLSDNFGSLQIVGSGEDRELLMQIRDVRGRILLQERVALGSLRRP